MAHSPALHVRVKLFDLEAIDELARADGVRRSDMVRRLLRVGLAAQRSPTGTHYAPHDDWQSVAAELEREYPERWALAAVDEP